ncbi:hypothetical protein [Caldisalinibacter kiritimatiensis]|uniref:Uncharacterized protein n=1 Tax=Caldisalinibacter kiritimatiensis TaxID=1304284 RepID=R1CYL3_9FIRM|nr:hypothetical protein [Caldisalinibacter kiritimatiensis]EOD01669.1 hypothetical protein L21TH_0275 [Caldisalinibacter kiritimatiensis]
MKKVSKILVFVFVLLISIKIYDVQALDEYDTDKLQIEGILKKRTEIMNKVIFGNEQYDKEKIKLLLADIETGDILTSDMEMIEEVKNNATDLGYINDVKVKKIESIEQINNLISMNVSLEWSIICGNQKELVEQSYKLNLIKESRKLLIENLKPINIKNASK